MKTKKRLLGLFATLCLTGPYALFAQDVSINVTPLQPSILNYNIGMLEVVICNEDPSPITAPANRLWPLVSFPENHTILDVVNQDGSPLTGAVVEVLTNDPGDHNVRVLITQPLPNAECFTYRIRFSGNAVGDDVITATLSFKDGPQTPGNITGNDNSTATTPVLENTLPVTLKTFEVYKEGEATANLQWTTTEEINSDYFEIEKSGDGKKWNVLERVAALGDDRNGKTYTASDPKLIAGINYYRLHMVDKDGTSAYSQIRSIKTKGEENYIYPNPVSDELKISIDAVTEIESVRVTDVNGREVYKSKTLPTSSINVRNFKAGVYIVRIKKMNGEETTSKVLVVK